MTEGRLVELATVGSTMDVARDLVRSGRRDVRGVRADYQSSGRGRTGGVWLAPPGSCLLVTYILWDAASITPPMLALGAGMAIAETVEGLTALAAGLKWPNDVILRGRKVAGVLIETVLDAAGSNVPLVGVGLNVNIERFPAELSSHATSLLLECGRLELAAVEASLVARLARTWQSEQLVERWRARDVTPGCRFRAVVDGAEVEGVAEGIADSGALLLRTALGVREVISATGVRRAEA